MATEDSTPTVRMITAEEFERNWAQLQQVFPQMKAMHEVAEQAAAELTSILRERDKGEAPTLQRQLAERAILNESILSGQQANFRHRLEERDEEIKTLKRQLEECESEFKYLQGQNEALRRRLGELQVLHNDTVMREQGLKALLVKRDEEIKTLKLEGRATVDAVQEFLEEVHNRCTCSSCKVDLGHLCQEVRVTLRRQLKVACRCLACRWDPEGGTPLFTAPSGRSPDQ